MIYFQWRIRNIRKKPLQNCETVKLYESVPSGFDLDGAKTLGQRPLQLINPLPGDGRDGVELQLSSLGVGCELFELVGIDAVDLGGENDHGLLGQRLLTAAVPEAGQFLIDDLEVFNRFGAAGCIGHVDEMDEQASALNMAQKLDAEARPQVRALDEPRHVGNNEGLEVGLLAHSDNAQIGLESGERIVGNLGLGGRDPRNKCGFAGVGIADQAHIGEQLQFQPVVALFACTSQFVLARSLMGAGGKVLVAAPTAPALGNDQAVVGNREVVDQLAGFLVVK